MKRVFIDTNVALDYLLERKPFYAEAKDVFTLASNRIVKLYLSSLSFSNIAYITRKHFVGEELYSILEDTSKLSDISPLRKQEINNAIAIKANDFEDALQYFSAKAVKADCIVTRNTKDFPFSDIPVLTPHDFLGLQL